MTTLDLIGVTKDATTAGPGKRFELFTKGCIRGVINPCKGCFNEETWTFEGPKRTFEINEISDIIERDAWNRQVTFCGGEPIIQAIALTALAKELKQRDPSFNIVMYTAYKFDTLLKHGLKFTWVEEKHGAAMSELLKKHSKSYEIREMDFKQYPISGSYTSIAKRIEFQILSQDDVIELLKYVDCIVDGDYQQDKRLTTSAFMHEGWFIGSYNQRVIKAEDTLNTCDYENGEMSYLYADDFNKYLSEHQRCLSCGHTDLPVNSDYCNALCESRYKERIKFLNSEGFNVKEGIY